MSTYSVCYLQAAAVRQCSHAHTTSILQHYICSTMSIKNPLVPDLKKKKVSFFIAVKMVLLVIPSISIFSFQTTFVANKIAGVGYSPKNNCMQPHKKLSLKNIHIESFFLVKQRREKDAERFDYTFPKILTQQFIYSVHLGMIIPPTSRYNPIYGTNMNGESQVMYSKLK